MKTVEQSELFLILHTEEPEEEMRELGRKGPHDGSRERMGCASSVCEDVTNVTAGEGECWEKRRWLGSVSFLLRPRQSQQPL